MNTVDFYSSLHLGEWLIRKARAQARSKGVQAAARNLRKQGVPLNVALRVLARGSR